jgi:hypothetical protein
MGEGEAEAADNPLESVFALPVPYHALPVGLVELGSLTPCLPQ